MESGRVGISFLLTHQKAHIPDKVEGGENLHSVKHY